MYDLHSLHALNFLTGYCHLEICDEWKEFVLYILECSIIYFLVIFSLKVYCKYFMANKQFSKRITCNACGIILYCLRNGRDVYVQFLCTKGLLIFP
jgi:hypothetical protein